MDNITEGMQNKLKSLVSYLYQVTRGFETIAEDVECANLKTAIFTLSVEAKQYAEEITNQLKELDIIIPVTATDQLWKRIEINIHEQAGFYKGGEIAALCNNCENHFNKFYEDILGEYFPLNNFKDIITYQLYATKCAFMKIRLLNKMRFKNDKKVLN